MNHCTIGPRVVGINKPLSRAFPTRAISSSGTTRNCGYRQNNQRKLKSAHNHLPIPQTKDLSNNLRPQLPNVQAQGRERRLRREASPWSAMLDDDARKRASGQTRDRRRKTQRREKKATQCEPARREGGGPTARGGTRLPTKARRRAKPGARPEHESRRWRDGTEGRRTWAWGRTV